MAIKKGISKRWADKLLSEKMGGGALYSQYIADLADMNVIRTSPAELESLCRKLASELGLILFRDESSNIIYDGNKLNIARLGKRYFGYFLLHEVCHWQVAPQPHRFQREYGLGSVGDYDDEAEKASKQRPFNERQFDELLALVMSTVWLKTWGFEQENFQNSLFEPIFDVNFVHPGKIGDIFEKALATLIQVGMCTRDFEGIAVARISEMRKRSGAGMIRDIRDRLNEAESFSNDDVSDEAKSAVNDLMAEVVPGVRQRIESGKNQNPEEFNQLMSLISQRIKAEKLNEAATIKKIMAGISNVISGMRFIVSIIKYIGSILKKYWGLIASIPILSLIGLAIHSALNATPGVAYSAGQTWIGATMVNVAMEIAKVMMYIFGISMGGLMAFACSVLVVILVILVIVMRLNDKLVKN